MKILKGIAGAPGIARGRTVFYEKKEKNRVVTEFDMAIQNALVKIRQLYDKTLRELGADHAKIFAAYEMLLEDQMLISPIKLAVEGGTEPVEAVNGVINQMSSILASKNNEYMNQRADDIRYIGKLIIEELYGGDEAFALPEGDEKVIVTARELTPVDTMQFDSRRLAGLATQEGGATSHTVILAKSLGIPAVVGISGLDESEGTAFIDGYKGELVLDPDPTILAVYEKRLEDEQELGIMLETLKSTDACTKDGTRIKVCINIGNPAEIAGVGDMKYDGVGLFRSEFLFSSQSTKPGAEQQKVAYKKVIDEVYPNPVTIRTIDVGGDKQLQYLDMKKDDNPFLGNRGIRLCFNNPDIFKEQLEAILTASPEKPVNIMLPMITSVSEISRTREFVSEIEGSLRVRGIPYCEKLSLGIMIETPASAITADILAEHCDFFSIGTNDLVQYIMAADRSNCDVEKLYNPYHPAVIRMINNVISEGNKAGIEVSVCGDIAANTDFTVLLLGMGLKKFSVPLPMVSRIKYIIGRTDMATAKRFAEDVLRAENEDDVSRILKGE